MPAAKPTLTFALLLLTWWVANNVYAVDAELFFRRFPSRHLYVDLTLIHTLTGILLTAVFTRAATVPAPSDKYAPHAAAVGLLHFLGALLTNLSYALIGSTTTLMWKLTEPCSAIVLKRLVLQHLTSPTSIVGVFITLSGVLHFSRASFTFTTFSPIILSNLVFPTRNVFIKLSQTAHRSPAHRFLTMLLTASPLCLITFAIKALTTGLDPPALPYMLRNALLFNAYQIASFLLLERLDPLTHSLLNTLKRFSAILVSMLLIRAPFHRSHYQAIAITIIGFSVYLAGASTPQQKFRHNALPLFALFAITCTLIFSTHLETALHTPPSQILSSRLSTPTNTQKNPRYVVMRVHDYQSRSKHVNYTTYEDAVNDDGKNVGNLIWQYGAHEALPDFTNTTTCSTKNQDCLQMAAASESKVLYYLPVACIMNPKFPDVFKGSVEGMLKGNIDEILIVGMGVQVEFTPNTTKPEFKPGETITYTTRHYPIPPLTKQFFNLMTQRGGITLLRGDFTRGVVQRLGFQRAYSVGCPSFWINQDVHLGKSLQQKYQAIAKRIRDPTLKVAVNVKLVKGFSNHLKYIRDHYPLARFYCQGVADLNMLKNHDIPFERARFFRTVEHWMADLREMDVSYGVRIHGNMIALGAGLPVVVVASDWRVLELVRVMKIPHFTTFDDVFSEDIDIARLVKLKVDEFDGEDFDRNRCQIAKVYRKVFRRYSIGVQQHVKRISQLC